jgi:hypothetical protein
MFGGTMLVLWATAPGLSLAARGVIAAAGVVVVALGVRTLCEGVWIEHDGVLVRNVFRSWRLRWDEIAFVGPSEHWFSLSFTLHDGRRIPARGVGAITRAKRGQLASRIMAVRPRGA